MSKSANNPKQQKTTVSKKVDTTRRYSEEERRKILGYIDMYNKENGRGGQEAARVKYGVWPVTLKAWQNRTNLSGSPMRIKQGEGRTQEITDRIQTICKHLAQVPTWQKELKQLSSML